MSGEINIPNPGFSQFFKHQKTPKTPEIEIAKSWQIRQQGYPVTVRVAENNPTIIYKNLRFRNFFSKLI